MSGENIAFYNRFLRRNNKVSACYLRNKSNNKVHAIPLFFDKQHKYTLMMYTYSFHRQTLKRSVIFEIVISILKHKNSSPSFYNVQLALHSLAS